MFAAGDAVRTRHPGEPRGIRLESFTAAGRQGEVAAHTVLGEDEAFTDVPWWWSDQYDANLQYAGHHTGTERLVVRGSLEERRFVAFYVDGGVVRAAASLNSGRDLRRAFGLIRSGVHVGDDALRDPDVDLRTLAPKP